MTLADVLKVTAPTQTIVVEDYQTEEILANSKRGWTGCDGLLGTEVFKPYLDSEVALICGNEVLGAGLKVFVWSEEE
jgi:hypothetical protein